MRPPAPPSSRLPRRAGSHPPPSPPMPRRAVGEGGAPVVVIEVRHCGGARRGSVRGDERRLRPAQPGYRRRCRACLQELQLHPRLPPWVHS
ncbi:hypothetical protein GUJ93_ZPchr0007g3778 [Zizania palustris]|uniref:Uncharacterized protein n=1 Tax=Zizania palustris TaxID=103762 RepID=A0A8J5VPF5_ZIZPA|nr:hypothetical protein GUJ93_ZPchr0007g3778 [Zizania palustris]